MMRVVGYVRVSTDEQSIGPRAQLEAMASWCAANGAELLEVHTDEGVSGAADIDKCPALLSAIDGTAEADVLLVAKRDRLARDVIKAAVVGRMVERNGARVESVDGVGNGDTPADQLMRTMIDAFAQYERQIIGARTRVALAQLRSEGVQLGGEALGWARTDLKDEHGRRVVREVGCEARVVERVLELRSLGATYAVIAATMTEEGHPTKRGGRWYASTVRAIVKRHERQAAA